MSDDASISPSAAQPQTAELRDEILVNTDVAALLKCSVRHVNDLAKAGDIPCRRVGRKTWFRRRRILDWIASGSRRDQDDDPSGKGVDVND